MKEEDQAATATFLGIGGAKRKAAPSRFQALMVPIATLRKMSSGSLKCRCTAS